MMKEEEEEIPSVPQSGCSCFQMFFGALNSWNMKNMKKCPGDQILK